MEYKGELNNLINILLISFVCMMVAFDGKEILVHLKIL
jgi:hypothetical protein